MLPIISAEERLKERHSAKVGLIGFPGVGKPVAPDRQCRQQCHTARLGKLGTPPSH